MTEESTKDPAEAESILIYSKDRNSKTRILKALESTDLGNQDKLRKQILRETGVSLEGPILSVFKGSSTTRSSAKMARQKTRIISDSHFGHKSILKFRPEFSSIREHDETVMENILQTCARDDTLWLLGDMFFDRESLENYGLKMKKYVRYVHLVLGNHDTDRNHRAQSVRRMTEIFTGVHSMRSMRGFWLTHAPMHPDELRGKVNVHGHVHKGTLQDYSYFNASCENIGYAPVSLDRIRDGYRGELFDYENARGTDPIA